MKRIFLFALLILGCSVSFAADNADSGTVREEVVPAPFRSSCFQKDPELGRVPRPNCEVRIRPAWASDSRLFQFNQMGLRDKDYPAEPPKGTTRILLMGPMFDGINLNIEQMASRKLEQRLKLLGVKDVEVINGSVSGFYAPRSAEWAIRMMEAYHPDIVAYFESGDFANFDFMESRSLQHLQDGSLMFVPQVNYVAAPHLLEWMWPSEELQRQMSSSFSHLSGMWKIHRESKSSKQEADRFMEPLTDAFHAIIKHMTGKQRLVVFFSARPASMGLTAPETGSMVTSFLNHFAPTLVIPAQIIKNSLEDTGAHTYPLVRGFHSPIQNELMFEKKPSSLTAQGSVAFAWSAAPWLRREIEAIGKTKVGKSQTPIFVQGSGHRRHGRRRHRVTK